MKGRIISDWSKVNFHDEKSRKEIFGALQYFMQAPEREAKALHGKVTAAIQAFGTSGDFPTRINEIFEKFHLTTMYDAGWEQVFDVKDFTGTNEAGWDIVDVEDGLTFRKVPIDGKARIYKMAGAKVSVEFDIYGAGLGWHRTLIDDKKWWTLEDNAVAFRNKYYSDKAAIFYALIEAVSSAQNVTWQNPEPSTLANTNELYTANRDAQTLNKAVETLIGNVKDKGYGITLATPFIVLTSYQIAGRINRALSLMLQAVAGSATQAIYRFTPVVTTMLASSSYYYVILPKVKAQAGNRMDLTIFNKFDEESYSDVAIGWGRYAGAIGDEEQFQRCAIS
jgi:hypothetical protein